VRPSVHRARGSACLSRGHVSARSGQQTEDADSRENQHTTD
jgi:hypothetical protein